MSDAARPPEPAALEPGEIELVTALQSGEPAAFEQLVRRHGPRMLAVARQILGSDSDADDALQDAFVTVFRSIGSFEGKSQLSTWLHRVAVNAALMRLRSRKRKREQPIDDLLPQFIADGHEKNPGAPWNPAALAGIELEETRWIVRAQIDRLPEDYRTVLVLRDLQELDTRAVAELLGLSEGNVKVRLHRARQALRTLLSPYFLES